MAPHLVVAQNSHSAFTELIKTAVRRSAVVPAGKPGANTWGFQGRMEEAFPSRRRYNRCPFQGDPEHCTSRPHPAWISPAATPHAALTS